MVSISFTGGRLSHEWLCSMYQQSVKMRLNWARHNQKQLKSHQYNGLVDALNNGEDIKDIGERIVLPSSHELSPRYYNEKQSITHINI